MSGTPAFFATFATASMSVITPPGLAIDSMKIALVLVLTARSKVPMSSGSPDHVPAEILEGMVELIDGAAIELFRCDEFVARPHQTVHDDHLSGVTGCNRKPGGAAFERRDTLLQHGIGGIADARIDVAEGLQPEQGRGVIDVFEHEGRRLIDWRRPRAGRGIGLWPGMNRECCKAWGSIGHWPVLSRL